MADTLSAVNRFSPNCCPTEETPIGDDCVNCDASTTPQFLKVTVTGSIAGDDCDTCPSIPATYIVEQEAATNDCHWLLETCHCATAPLAPSEVFVQVTTIGSDYFLRAEIVVRCSAGRDEAVFLKNLGPTSGGTPNCLFNSESLTFNAMQNDNGCCGDFSALSMTVDADMGPQDTERQCSYLTWNTGGSLTATFNSAPTDNDCSDCDELTTSVTLTQQDIPNCCRWDGSYAGSACTYSYRLTITESTYQLVVSDDNFVTTATFQLTGLTAPHNGQTTRTLSFVSATSTACTWTGTTVDIAAA